MHQFAKRERKLMVVGCAAFCWSVWKTRNVACFQNKILLDPSNLIHRICHWNGSWFILQKEEDPEALQEGVRRLQLMVAEIFQSTRGWAPLIKRLT